MPWHTLGRALRVNESQVKIALAKRDFTVHHRIRSTGLDASKRRCEFQPKRRRLPVLGPAPQVAAHPVGKIVDLLLSSRQRGLGPRGARGGSPFRPARLPAGVRRSRCPPEHCYPEKCHDAVPSSHRPVASRGAHYPGQALPSQLTLAPGGRATAVTAGVDPGRAKPSNPIANRLIVRSDGAGEFLRALTSRDSSSRRKSPGSGTASPGCYRTVTVAQVRAREYMARISAGEHLRADLGVRQSLRPGNCQVEDARRLPPSGVTGSRAAASRQKSREPRGPR
jgi:hypothetical protein